MTGPDSRSEMRSSAWRAPDDGCWSSAISANKNDDRARVSDLPLEMAAIGFVWIHARGRIPVRFSLARDGEHAAGAFPAKNESLKGHQTQMPIAGKPRQGYPRHPTQRLSLSSWSAQLAAALDQ